MSLRSVLSKLACLARGDFWSTCVAPCTHAAWGPWLVITLAGLAGPCHAEVIAADRLLEVVELASPTLSPDGSRVAFRAEQASIDRNTYDSAWYIADIRTGSTPRMVGNGGVPARGSAGTSLPPKVVWSPDGTWIYYRAQLDGTMAVWRAGVGLGAEVVTREDADVRDFHLSEDGALLVYSVGATRDRIAAAERFEYERGVRLDERLPLGRPLFERSEKSGLPGTQRFAGAWFDLAPLLAEEPDRWRVVEIVGGVRRDAEADEIAAFLSVRPSHFDKSVTSKWIQESEGDRVALLIPNRNERGTMDATESRLAWIPAFDSLDAIWCEAVACRGRAITGMQWRRGTDEVVFTATEAGHAYGQSIFRWNVVSGAVLPVVQSRGLLSGGRDASSDCGLSSTVLVCVAAAADLPPRLEVIDLDAGTRRVLYDPNAVLAADIEANAPAQLLAWTDAQGRRFTGWLFAARVEPAPLFVTYYRCTGFLRGGVGDEWPLATLAGHGISALCINAPPHSREALERYAGGLSAVAGAIEMLASNAQVRADRVGIGGLSFGSEIALWVATESSLVSAVSISTPVVSPTYFLMSSMKGDQFLDGLHAYWGLGAPQDTPDRWEALSPAYKLDRPLAPILFQMSEQEHLYAADYVIPLVRDRRGDAYVFADEPHQKIQPRHKLAVYERNLDWFRFWLQGVEDSDPDKAAQYAYWRSMRAGGPGIR
ncbi:Atxe2 family lasso peptide isopeptidase [Luteimonas terrae]|uniref:Atxe2 family lasso peptide isopeptidase n=1 Tax=Luteimonas terrae TaxID=1530191 RepID=UPI003D2F5B15